MAKGKLIANIGMTLGEAQRQSSVKLEEGYSAQVFDFELAGSPMLAFKDCQYYLLRTGEGDAKLVEINIGIAPRKQSSPMLANPIAPSMRNTICIAKAKPRRMASCRNIGPNSSIEPKLET